MTNSPVQDVLSEVLQRHQNLSEPLRAVAPISVAPLSFSDLALRTKLELPFGNHCLQSLGCRLVLQSRTTSAVNERAWGWLLDAAFLFTITFN